MELFTKPRHHHYRALSLLVLHDVELFRRHAINMWRLVEDDLTFSRRNMFLRDAFTRLWYSSPFVLMDWHLLEHFAINTCDTWVKIMTTNMSKWLHSVGSVPSCLGDLVIAGPLWIDKWNRIWNLQKIDVALIVPPYIQSSRKSAHVMTALLPWH